MIIQDTNTTLQTKNMSTLSKRDERSLIFHLLYAVESFDYQFDLIDIIKNFNDGFDLSITSESYIFITTNAIISDKESIDSLYKPFLQNWSFDRISVCSKLSLRFGTWELSTAKTPHQVSINEAVELAKSFAEPDSYRLVNGILDRVAHHLQKTEQLP